MPAIIERVADAGFEGVEFANRFHEADPDAVADALAESDVEPIGAHVGLSELENDLDEHAERYKEIGCRTLVIPHLPISHFRTERRILELAVRLNSVGEMLADRGFDLVYHNQTHDFLPLSDRTPFTPVLVRDPPAAELLSRTPIGPELPSKFTALSELIDDRFFQLREQYRGRPDPPIDETAFGRLVSETDSDFVSFEVDIGAVTAAGRDPVEVLEYVDDRLLNVHLKDVASGQGIPGTGQQSVDPGTGEVDFQPAVDAARRIGAEWFVYEHDDPDDPVTTLRECASSAETLFVD
ncbi:sugar phosphate isomerase/epimerase family protein [Halalkalicoccus salilacus]|uniref:sugar phosphate isomerase/epimerase family protein n=1 Tax=Halalkalicoccus TaxID=332246 RepID=UPI002F96E2A6